MDKILDKLTDEIMSDPEIRKFCKENNINDDTFVGNITFLYQQKKANDVCNGCLGKKPCKMDVYQMQSILEYYHGNINHKYVNCKYLDIINDELLEMLFFPETQFDGKLFDSDARSNVYAAIGEFMQNPNSGKGLFIHGAFGTGKTFILLKLARRLIKLKLKVVFAYYPDLVRHIKSSIANNKVEPIVEKLKRTDILILDDIGGENNTSFIRDEVLGPLLQYRMLGNKPTFMTSNYDINHLRRHFMETRDEIDQIKSDRIIERITYMMRSIELKDKNYRHNV